MENDELEIVMAADSLEAVPVTDKQARSRPKGAFDVIWGPPKVSEARSPVEIAEAEQIARQVASEIREKTRDRTMLTAEESEQMLAENRMKFIRGLVSDPDVEVSDIMRMIAVEIAAILERMSSTEIDTSEAAVIKMKHLNDRVKNFRELQRTIMEANITSRRDALNIDGPKFQFVARTMSETWLEACRNAGASEPLTQSIMMQWSDLMRLREESIRRELNKIDGR